MRCEFELYPISKHLIVELLLETIPGVFEPLLAISQLREEQTRLQHPCRTEHDPVAVLLRNDNLEVGELVVYRFEKDHQISAG